MAQKGNKTITFNIDANTAEAEAKVRALSNNVEKVEKDGQIRLRADVDMTELNRMQSLIKNEKMKFSIETTGIKELQQALDLTKNMPDINKALQKQFSSIKKINFDTVTKNFKEAQGKIATDGLSDLVNQYTQMKTKLASLTKSGKEDWGLEEELLRTAKALQTLQKQAGKKIDLGEMLGISFADVDKTVTSLGKKVGNISGVDNLLKTGGFSSIIDQLKQAQSVILQLKNLSDLDIESLTKIPIDNINFGNVLEQITTLKSKAESLDEAINLKVNLSVDDELQRLRSELSSLSDETVKINIETNPSIDSIKSDLKALGDQKVNVKINLGKSLKNIEDLSKAFNSKGVHDSLHQLTTLGSGFSTAFANLRDATKAPSQLLDDLNAKAKQLKTTLDSVGVTKFKDIDKLNKQLEQQQKKQKSDLDKSETQMLNALVEEEAKLAKQKQKMQADSVRQQTKYQSELAKSQKALEEEQAKTSQQALADASQKKYKKELSAAQKTIDKALLSKDSLTDIGNIRSQVEKLTSELQGKMPNVGDIVDSTQISEINQMTMALQGLIDKKNQLYNNQGKLEENSFFSDVTKNLKEIDPKDISKRIDQMYKAAGKQVEKIKQKNADTWDVFYPQGDTMMKDTLKIQQFPIDGINQYATALRTATKAESEYMTAGQKWMAGFKSKMSNLTQYMTGADILYKAAQELREGFTFVKDLNSLMTTIDQTSDITGQGLQELSQGAIDQAKSLGVAAEQVTGSIEVYAAYRQTVDSLLKKAEPTTMLAKASGADVSTASSQILGVTKQFTDLEGQEERIVNAYEKIAANVQIDFASINILYWRFN